MNTNVRAVTSKLATKAIARAIGGTASGNAGGWIYFTPDAQPMKHKRVGQGWAVALNRLAIRNPDAATAVLGYSGPPRWASSGRSVEITRA